MEVLPEHLLTLGVGEVGAEDLANAPLHGHVGCEQDAVDAELLYAHLDHALVDDGPGGVQVDGGHVAQLLDRPLPLATAAELAIPTPTPFVYGNILLNSAKWECDFTTWEM